MHPFRSAIERGDLDAAIALFREDAIFSSPVVFTPYRGREALRQILEAVMAVFENFRYVHEIGAAGARDHVLVFEATVGGKKLEGADFIRLDEDGAITELTVMVRPLSATLTLAELMKARLAAT